MRPRTLDEFVGQEHILGPGRLLRRAIQADRLSSIILYGPPGTGKTTLARVIANTTESSFLSLNAVLSGVKEVREAVETAQRNRELYGRRTILFVDEVHRWNKAQQDALLPWVENGTVILIGATTENPFFEVISPLVSRSRVFQLKPLTREDLRVIARRALEDPVRGYGNYLVRIAPEALEHLIEVSDGDARNLLSALELAVETTPEKFPPPPGEEIVIDLAVAEESIQKRAVLYDKEGDYHYDTISAFIKSLRGSDPDAALYWMARMVRAGEDPHFIFRRMLILAGEDVGLADPMALVVVEAAARAFDRVGMPEGQYHLTEAALYLSTCPKSNSSLGYFDALKAVEEEGIRDVPSHLKDSSRDAVGFGHGEGYKYPHAYREHWVAQNYLPPELRGRVFYHPTPIGHEGNIREEVLRKREAQLLSVLEEPDELFTFSPQDKSRDEWMARTLSGGGKIPSTVRDRLFKRIDLKRHERVLVLGRGSGFLLWEALRRVPEGWVWAAVGSQKEAETLKQMALALPEIEQPRVVRAEELLSLSTGSGTKKEEAVLFDAVAGRGVFTDFQVPGVVTEVMNALKGLLAPGGRIGLAEPVVEGGSRIFTSFGDLFGIESLPSTLRTRILEAEGELYDSLASGRFSGKKEEREALIRFLEQGGWEDVELEEETFQEERIIQDRNVEDWFGEIGPLSEPDSPATSGRKGRKSLGSLLKNKLDPEEREILWQWLRERLPRKTLLWKSRFLFLYGKVKG
jgi:putative ATPase